MRRVHPPDGTTWPVDSDGGVQYRLRYMTEVDRETAMSAASIVAAYSQLLSPHHTMKRAVEKLRMLRREAHKKENGT